MTKEEFINEAVRVNGKPLEAPHISMGTYGNMWIRGSDAVKQAITEGKPVPRN